MTDSGREPEITLPPPARSSLLRMRQAAADRAYLIEGSQIARIKAGIIKGPESGELALRDDFDAIVRLIDQIMASDELKDLLK